MEISNYMKIKILKNGDVFLGEKGKGFIMDDGNIALTKCPKCGLENYAMNVLSGMCTWCEFKIKKDDKPSKIK